MKKVFSQSNQLTTKTAGDRIKTATKEMKKILLVLIALMGIGFGAKAQSCEVGKDTYVSVNASVQDGKIDCTAYCYGDAKATSGTVYATVYYIDENLWYIIDNSCFIKENLSGIFYLETKCNQYGYCNRIGYL